MKNLKHLLERFAKALNKDAGLKEQVADIVLQTTQIRLKVEDIGFKEGNLTITTSQAGKSEIKLKEEVIMAALKSRGVPVLKIGFR